MDSPNKTVIESVAGSTPVALLAAALAASNPESVLTISMVYAALPVLVSSLARRRNDSRQAEWATDVNGKLLLLGRRIEKISDEHYRLLGGIVQAAFEATDDEKLRMLRAASLNVAGSDYLNHFEAQFLSRTLRDISAPEVAFLVKHRDEQGFYFRSGAADTYTRHLCAISPGSMEASYLHGLQNLGRLSRSPDTGTFADVGAYHWTQMIGPLLRVLVEKTAD